MLSRNKIAAVAGALALCGVIICRNGAPIARAQSQITAPTPTPTPRADQTAFIEGRIFDARTKTPIAGAQISWEGNDGTLETVSDANGNYKVGPVVADVGGEGYAYSVQATGYSVRSNYAASEANRYVAVPASGLKFDFAMLRTAKARGQVKESGGAAIVGAHVNINGETVTTDKNGIWSLNDISVPFPEGVVTLETRTFDARFSQVKGRIKVSASNQAKIVQTMLARAVISGRITRAGKPLKDITVMTNNDEGLGSGFDQKFNLPDSNTTNRQRRALQLARECSPNDCIDNLQAGRFNRAGSGYG